MSSIKFAHIAPTEFLDLTEHNGAHLILAHLIEQDEAYRDYYKYLNDGKYVIMDNSAFEMYKQGREMYPTEKLIEMAKEVGADCIVMSDYPNEPGEVTIRACQNTIAQYKAAGFDVFFVPQSKIGDFDDYIKTLAWSLDNPDIDVIGLSILGCPNAFGVERDNKLQRFMSRWAVLNKLEELGYFDDDRNINRFHCLGMVDGPQEISLLEKYHPYIRTWDSSAAIWYGLNGHLFDNSPTGLVNGKFELEVDFDMKRDEARKYIPEALNNIMLINSLCAKGDANREAYEHKIRTKIKSESSGNSSS